MLKCPAFFWTFRPSHGNFFAQNVYTINILGCWEILDFQPIFAHYWPIPLSSNIKSKIVDFHVFMGLLVVFILRPSLRQGMPVWEREGVQPETFFPGGPIFHSLSLTPGVGWELMPCWSLSVMIDLGGWRAWRHGGWIWAWEKCPQGERKLNL